jgi:hypothetical protein
MLTASCRMVLSSSSSHCPTSAGGSRMSVPPRTRLVRVKGSLAREGSSQSGRRQLAGGGRASVSASAQAVLPRPLRPWHAAGAVGLVLQTGGPAGSKSSKNRGGAGAGPPRRCPDPMPAPRRLTFPGTGSPQTRPRRRGAAGGCKEGYMCAWRVRQPCRKLPKACQARACSAHQSKACLAKGKMAGPRGKDWEGGETNLEHGLVPAKQHLLPEGRVVAVQPWGGWRVGQSYVDRGLTRSKRSRAYAPCA